MTVIGAYQAKTHFSEILERVSKGEKITITKHGVPVAYLSPTQTNTLDDVAQAIQSLRKLRKGKTLAGLKIKNMIEEGRA